MIQLMYVNIGSIFVVSGNGLSVSCNLLLSVVHLVFIANILPIKLVNTHLYPFSFNILQTREIHIQCNLKISSTKR